MDTSTNDVTLCAVFVQDVLRPYVERQDEFAPIFKMAQEYDLDDPFSQVPIKLYNNICQWIEDNLGKVSTKRLGREIGKTVYVSLHQNKLIGREPHPHEIMEALANVAQQMIKDPKKRGWEIIDKQPNSLTMLRTQTFNSTLQFGLLETLLYKCNVSLPNVELIRSVEQGDEYDEYFLSWKK